MLSWYGARLRVAVPRWCQASAPPNSKSPHHQLWQGWCQETPYIFHSYLLISPQDTITGYTIIFDLGGARCSWWNYPRSHAHHVGWSTGLKYREGWQGHLGLPEDLALVLPQVYPWLLPVSTKCPGYRRWKSGTLWTCRNNWWWSSCAIPMILW